MKVSQKQSDLKSRTGRNSIFKAFARTCVRMTGHPLAFGLAVTTILLWALTGPIFHFGDSWQLVINTATTIITFLMVFLLQNAQNRDSAAVQLKLDELIRATEAAHNAFLDLEEISEPELERIKARFGSLAEKARRDVRTGRSDLGCPDVKGQPGKNGSHGIHTGREPRPAPAASQTKTHKGKGVT